MCWTYTNELQGILVANAETLNKDEVMLGLWKHECHRVIADRFTNQPDKDWFGLALDKVSEIHQAKV